ncbi:hypothetical protein EYF80_018685 [Liparis tanakae]|uniref:Uncharacterized protein n=1 Tax=Liparis tanakae TaxID=230148 RepID=A0A4Z2I167_9TELE|nr:hypothetical protein EYF80_018685 [Liparis tanakae]
MTDERLQLPHCHCNCYYYKSNAWDNNAKVYLLCPVCALACYVKSTSATSLSPVCLTRPVDRCVHRKCPKSDARGRRDCSAKAFLTEKPETPAPYIRKLGLMELGTRRLLYTRELDPCPVPSKQP